MTLRYYAKRKGNNYELLNNQVSFVDDNISVKTLKFIGKLPPFVELLFEVKNGKPVLKNVTPLHVDSVGYEAIKATVSHNEAEVKKTEENNYSNDFLHERKEIAQQVLDRVILYGENFEIALEALFEKFPITVSIDKPYRKAAIKAS